MACGIEVVNHPPDRGSATMRLAEMLAVRLCHDFSGKLGTLMGAIELLTDDPDSAAEALTLAEDASGELARRLRLARVAWGGGGGPMAVSEFRSMTEDLAGRRTSVTLDVPDPTASFSGPGGRLALNVVMLATEALPAGGAVVCAGDPTGEMLVTIDGPRAAWPAGFAGFLSDEAQVWDAVRDHERGTPRALQPMLTALIARSAGLRLSFLMAAASDRPPPLLMNLAG